MIRILLIFIFLISSTIPHLTFAGACDPDVETKEKSRRNIDGPANVRHVPLYGKVVASLPDKKEVVLIAYTRFGVRAGIKNPQLWYEIEWEDNGKILSGWTIEKNIRCD